MRKILKPLLTALLFFSMVNSLYAEKQLNTLVDTGKNSAKPAVNEFYKFFTTTLRYPYAARNSSVQGYVSVTFTIADNKISDVKIVKGPEYGMEEEITRALQDVNRDKNVKLLNSLQPGKYGMNFRFVLAGANSELGDERISVPEKIVGYTYLNEVVIVAYSTRR